MSIDIANLRKLLADGPPGPWRLRPSQQSSAGYISVYANESDLITGQFTAYEGRGPIEADAALIVAAVNALPELLDEVERLRTLAIGRVGEAVMKVRIAQLEAALRRVFDEQGWVWVRDVLEGKGQAK